MIKILQKINNLVQKVGVVKFWGLALLITVFIGWMSGVFVQGNNFFLPQGEVDEKITITKMPEESTNTTPKTEEIMITDGVRHSIPLEEIISGGPPKDGIPSIDNPQFISIEEANEFIADNEPGVFVEINDIARFYPFQILVWHEIVNDEFDGEPVLVTYCPLCLSAIVFAPKVDGEDVEFGVSGKLWQSNLLMYDRKTDSLWSQILGKAVVGVKTGATLEVLPSDQINYAEFKENFPMGEVLSRNTGATKFYGRDPYGDYYSRPDPLFRVNSGRDELEPKDFVLGVVINEQAKAYLPETIKEKGEVMDTFADTELVLRYVEDIGAVRIFKKDRAGELVRINPFGTFWFAWAAAHPQTEVYQ